MIFVASVGAAAGDTERVYAVWIVGEKACRFQVVHPGSAPLGALEVNAAVSIRARVGIGAKIMVERNVFLEDDHDVLDWCAGSTVVVILGESRRNGRKRKGGGGQN